MNLARDALEAPARCCISALHTNNLPLGSARFRDCGKCLGSKTSTGREVSGITSVPPQSTTAGQDPDETFPALEARPRRLKDAVVDHADRGRAISIGVAMEFINFYLRARNGPRACQLRPLLPSARLPDRRYCRPPRGWAFCLSSFGQNCGAVAREFRRHRYRRDRPSTDRPFVRCRIASRHRFLRPKPCRL